MKYIKWLTFLLVFFLLLTTSYEAMALDVGLSTQSLSSGEISNILKVKDFTKITSFVPRTVKCFDVREDHMIVIGSGSADTATIAVYNSQGDFQYGFQTKEPGSFRVMWHGNDIAYYSIRSAYLYTINTEGEILDICQVENSIENSIFDRDVLQATTRKMGETTYHVTNGRTFVDAFSTSFKHITKTDSLGTSVIYDASNNQHTRVVVGIIVFFVISLIIVNVCVVGVKKHRKTGDGLKS